MPTEEEEEDLPKSWMRNPLLGKNLRHCSNLVQFTRLLVCLGSGLIDNYKKINNNNNNSNKLYLNNVE
jgi:hypothetical protein